MKNRPEGLTDLPGWYQDGREWWTVREVCDFPFPQIDRSVNPHASFRTAYVQLWDVPLTFNSAVTLASPAELDAVQV